jgi:hypothetical protein
LLYETSGKYHLGIGVVKAVQKNVISFFISLKKGHNCGSTVMVDRPGPRVYYRRGFRWAYQIKLVLTNPPFLDAGVSSSPFSSTMSTTLCTCQKKSCTYKG